MSANSFICKIVANLIINDPKSNNKLESSKKTAMEMFCCVCYNRPTTLILNSFHFGNSFRSFHCGAIREVNFPYCTLS